MFALQIEILEYVTYSFRDSDILTLVPGCRGNPVPVRSRDISALHDLISQHERGLGRD